MLFLLGQYDLGMTPAGEIVRQAYLERGITDSEALSRLSGLSVKRVRAHLKDFQQEVACGETQYGFLSRSLSLGEEALREVYRQRESHEASLEAIAERKEKFEVGSAEWMRLVNLELKLYDALNRVNGVDILLKVVEKKALKTVDEDSSFSHSSAPVSQPESSIESYLRKKSS